MENKRKPELEGENNYNLPHPFHYGKIFCIVSHTIVPLFPVYNNSFYHCPRPSFYRTSLSPPPPPFFLSFIPSFYSPPFLSTGLPFLLPLPLAFCQHLLRPVLPVVMFSLYFARVVLDDTVGFAVVRRVGVRVVAEEGQHRGDIGHVTDHFVGYLADPLR